MDSETIGIPRDAPGGYYVTDVLYTQYFTNEGHALHYNYWVDPAAFGSFPTSHGCIGLTLDDAKYFWDFASIGTPIVIHE
jgi:lipoprotein-anchoring transpeptidase ErfK/SrfK